MPMPNDVQRKFLSEATSKYHNDLKGSPAEEFLANRGLNPRSPEVAAYHLGYVSDPLPGHENNEGSVAIPYLRWSPDKGQSTVNMKFRCLRDHDCKAVKGHGKYMTSPGTATNMFNTLAAINNNYWIAVCEGELDAVVAEAHGVPAVGIPGTENWLPKFRSILEGYEKVFVLADNDDEGQGMKFARKLAKELSNVLIVPALDGHDVTSEITSLGVEGLKERMGI